MALLEFLELERGMGRLAIVETLGAGPRGARASSACARPSDHRCRPGRGEGKRGEGPPPLDRRGCGRRVLSVIHPDCSPAALCHGGSWDWGAEPEPLVELVNPLMSMVVLPYLGAVAARGELDRPTPARNGADSASVSNPLKCLKMRLTYRTVRVLMAVGSHPGVSNRRVGKAAGVSGPGPDLKAARAPGVPRPDRERRLWPGQGRVQLLASQRPRPGYRAGDPRAGVAPPSELDADAEGSLSCLSCAAANRATPA